ncbi:histidine kinase [Algoriphagus sp. AGSA1]|uniref:sensor histidine kinase n=1 Tax=Algoriphagus sp. AGSA1 TaxID=2907213 RepID=UPI001F35B90F|nr:histidine kinase [Algoriphagus sp. AGSA1]MCE7055693.1 histidine kinase [Algoriphagus sp. AGSA1]
MTPLTQIKPIYRLLLPLPVGTLVYLGILLAFDTVGNITEDFFTREFLFCVLASYALLEVNQMLLVLFEKKLQRGALFMKHTIALLLASIIASLVSISLLLIAYFYWFENMADVSIYMTELKIFNGIFLFVTLMYQSHFLGFYFIHNKFEHELEKEQQHEEELRKSVDLFHYMLNPQFLLAGLESIVLRIKENRNALAEEGIVLLSDIYRHSLRTQEELVSLEDELTAMKSEEVFLNQFISKNISISIPEDLDNFLLVPRTLTKILEAIAYSQLSSSEFGLEILLEIRNKDLIISFPSAFSLTTNELLFETLSMIKKQYGWLNKSLHWSDNSTFSIYIPLEVPFPTTRPDQISIYSTDTIGNRA